ncbi:MAG: hypothetical protein J1F68_01110 [Clostridiales bacterium]|nr:hypothetical protein [Clostridiales bacterium]
MKQVKPTKKLLEKFKSYADTLIFEGYCTNADSVVTYNDGDSYALIADVNGDIKCCFKTDSAEFVLAVVSKLKLHYSKVEFSGVDPFVTNILRSSYDFVWETNCYLYVWNGKPLSYECKQEISPMSPNFAQKISDGTHYHAPIADILEVLRRHPSAAIYVDGKPVCWCLLHLEKSLGMLYTEPEHRRKGYALEVMTALCNMVIAKGDIPYAYIVCDNVASQNLAPKYNLERVRAADYFLVNFN